MDSAGVFIGVFMAIFSGQEKKAEAPQRLTPLRREKLPRSFEKLPSASERFGKD